MRKHKWDFDTCAAVALQFDRKADFRALASREFQWLHRNGLLDKACAHMLKVRRSLSDDDVAEIAKRYVSRRTFKLGDQAAYQAARKRGILDAVCSHMETRYREQSNEQLAEIAGRFNSRVEFLRADSGAYQAAAKRGILDIICSHMEYRETRRLSDDEILEIARQYRTKSDFQWADFGAYITATRRGLLEAACAHMEYGGCGFREDKPAVIYQFRIETTDGLVLYKVGITNRLPKQRLATMGVRPGVTATLLKVVKFTRGRDARLAEQCLHRVNAGLRYRGEPVMQNGNTELFTIPLIP